MRINLATICFDDFTALFTSQKELDPIQKFSLSNHHSSYSSTPGLIKRVWIKFINSCLHPPLLFTSLLMPDPSYLREMLRYSRLQTIAKIKNLALKVQYGSQFLCPAISVPKVYLPIPAAAAIKDPYLQQNLHPLHSKKINKGAVNWFNYLFLQVLKQASLPFEAQVVATASRFISGAPLQATLLESLPDNFLEKPLGYSYCHPVDLNQHSFLQLLFQIMNQSTTKKAFQVDPTTLSKQQLCKYFANLKDGVYKIRLHLATFSYVKNGGKSFLWDPAGGLLQFSPSQTLDYLSTKSSRRIHFMAVEKLEPTFYGIRSKLKIHVDYIYLIIAFLIALTVAKIFRGELPCHKA